MDFSPKQIAAEQLCKLVYGDLWEDYSQEYQTEEINRVVAGRGIHMAASRAVPIQMQLNAAVELLRGIYAAHPYEDVRDFLSAFPAAEGEPK